MTKKDDLLNWLGSVDSVEAGEAYANAENVAEGDSRFDKTFPGVNAAIGYWRQQKAAAVAPPARADWHRDYFADPEVVKKAKKCVFMLVEFRGGRITGSTPTEPLGTGFFVGRRDAISAKHNFSDDVKVGNKVHAAFGSTSADVFTLTVAHISERDYIKLTADTDHEHLEIYTGNEDMHARELILCAYQTAIKESVPDFTCTMGVMKASVNKVSAHGHYMMYQTTAWSGDSGAALLLSDGKVVALHLEAVNSFKEAALEPRNKREERLARLEDSLKDVMADSAVGYVALMSTAFEALP